MKNINYYVASELGGAALDPSTIFAHLTHWQVHQGVTGHSWGSGKICTRIMYTHKLQPHTKKPLDRSLSATFVFHLLNKLSYCIITYTSIFSDAENPGVGKRPSPPRLSFTLLLRWEIFLKKKKTGIYGVRPERGSGGKQNINAS